MVESLDWAAFAGRVAEFLGVEPATLERSNHIYDELGLDSLGTFSLGMHLIKCFGIRLPPAQVPSIATLGDLYDAFDRHRSAAP
jgi:acyl carrier protein